MRPMKIEKGLVLCQLMIPRELEGKLMTLARAKDTTVEEVIFRSLKRTAEEAEVCARDAKNAGEGG